MDEAINEHAVCIPKSDGTCSMMDAVVDGIITIDSEGQILAFNPAAEAMFGYTKEEITGRNISALMQEDFRVQHEEIVRQAPRVPGRQRVCNAREGVAVRKDGSELPVELTVSQIEAQDERVFLGIIRDISDRKAAEQELHRFNQTMIFALEREKQVAKELESALGRYESARTQAEAANQAKSEFLANMSHEIRTPMTSILGFTDLLLEQVTHQPALAPHIPTIHTIKRNGEHLIQIINDILDLSKIESGRMEMERAPLSPIQLLVGVVDLMRIRAESKGLALSYRTVEPAPKVIMTDATRLRQILINLVGNAIKFTETGNVDIIAATHTVGERTLFGIDVIDTGIGLTPEHREQVFLPFQQADNSHTREHGGIGLGLVISQRLAQQLGGDVHLVTSEPGQGSCFRVLIDPGPLDDPSWQTLSHPEPFELPDWNHLIHPPSTFSAARRELEGYHILLAEDGPDNQKLLTHVLTKAGAEVVLAGDGREALSAVHQARREGSQFDVILMDMQMPNLDGYEATATLRQQGYSGPIIALTAHAMQGDRERCLEAGCDDYATKPIKRKKLTKLILDCVSGTCPTKPDTPSTLSIPPMEGSSPRGHDCLPSF